MFKHLKTFEKFDQNKVDTTLFSPGFLEYYEALRDTGLFHFQQIVVKDTPYDHLVFAPIDEAKKYPIEKFDLFIDEDNMGEFVCIEYRSSDLIELDGLDSMFKYILNRSNVLIHEKNFRGTIYLWNILVQKNPAYLEECPKEYVDEIEHSLKPLAKTGIFN